MITTKLNFTTHLSRYHSEQKIEKNLKEELFLSNFEDDYNFNNEMQLESENFINEESQSIMPLDYNFKMTKAYNDMTTYYLGLFLKYKDKYLIFEVEEI